MVISSVCVVSVRLSLQRGGFVPREWLGAKVLLNSQMAKQEAIIGYFEVQPRSLELGGKSPGDEFVGGCTRDLVVYAPNCIMGLLWGWGTKFKLLSLKLLNIQNRSVTFPKLTR